MTNAQIYQLTLSHQDSNALFLRLSKHALYGVWVVVEPVYFGPKTEALFEAHVFNSGKQGDEDAFIFDSREFYTFVKHQELALGDWCEVYFFGHISKQNQNTITPQSPCNLAMLCIDGSELWLASSNMETIEQQFSDVSKRTTLLSNWRAEATPFYKVF